MKKIIIVMAILLLIPSAASSFPQCAKKETSICWEKFEKELDIVIADSAKKADEKFKDEIKRLYLTPDEMKAIMPVLPGDKK